MEARRTLDGNGAITYGVEVDGTPVTVGILSDGTIDIDGRRLHLDVSEIQGLSLYSLLIDDVSYEVVVDEKDDVYYALVQGKVHRIRMDAANGRPHEAAGRAAHGRSKITAPLCGLVVDVPVSIGQNVEADDVVVILESMKMENEIRTPCAGTVREINIQAGSVVREGDLLAVVA